METKPAAAFHPIFLHSSQFKSGQFLGTFTVNFYISLHWMLVTSVAAQKHNPLFFLAGSPILKSIYTLYIYCVYILFCVCQPVENVYVDAEW